MSAVTSSLVAVPAGRTAPTTVVRGRPVPLRRSHPASGAAYRRRRLAAAALGLGLAVAAGHVGGAFGGPPLATPERRPQVVSETVRRGDTLWSIAGRLDPDTDRREVVDALVAARGSDVIFPGETITWLGG